jgi:O-methyltransferase involved in polyketide biosynthesis
VTEQSGLDNGGASITAQRVAAYRLGSTRVPAQYGDPAADEALAADVAVGPERPDGQQIVATSQEPSKIRFVEADFTRDPIADRLTAAGFNPGQLSLMLLEGVAVYLEPAVLERVLTEFRQVARAGSRLAISVSVSSAHSETRSRFQASVAALGEPARSTLDAAQAAGLLARTGWQVLADAAARSDRLQSAGLLTANAANAAPAATPAPTS